MFLFLEIILKTHQIQISCFSRHFYVVNLILLSVLHFWTNFDERILFIFYGPFFKAMIISACPGAFKNISNRLMYMMIVLMIIKNSIIYYSANARIWSLQKILQHLFQTWKIQCMQDYVFVPVVLVSWKNGIYGVAFKKSVESSNGTSWVKIKWLPWKHHMC